MDNKVDDVIDSQFLAENVGFLDNCFDNSFTIQSSLKKVKRYFVENQTNERRNDKFKRNNSVHNRTSNLEVSTFQISQGLKGKALEVWGLPLEIRNKYKEKGITEMFEWQTECLSNPKVLFELCNLVYSAPTSAGKTLVAEILTIKTVIERQKKIIIILPFVSIVREKTLYFQDLLSSSGIRVEGFMGSQSPPGGLQSVHIAICTIEKANSLVNKFLDEGNIAELGAIIVDELHLLGDPNRGYILELLLTKIKYITSRSSDVSIQIVGMSATLPNLDVLASWLEAELFVTQFRPIPLDEYCLVGCKLYCKDGSIVNKFNSTQSDGNHVLNICLDTIKEGCSVLIFCMTKNRCESLAQSLAQSLYTIGSQKGEFSSMLRKQLNSQKILEVLEQLKNCPVGQDQILRTDISFGVAYHHAGLTLDERDIIEGGFKTGAIRILVATSTLSSGVNLPARKVIIRTPVFQRQPINIMTYKQMVGRAGRMGKDTKGESILICTENEKNIGFELMKGVLDPVKSCIETEDKYMRAVLEMIASQTLCTQANLEIYSKCTLLYAQGGITSENDLLKKTLADLKNFELIRVQKKKDEINYIATPLGKACLSASVAPNDGLSLFLELQKARQCLVLETDLHLIYLVTPYSVSSQWGDIDWIHLLSLWESMTTAMQRVGTLVGVQERFMVQCVRGNKPQYSQVKLNIHKRFYTALALQDLVNEVPLLKVASKFKCSRGFLQSLQQAAATFAGMVTAFCRQLGWKNMEILVSQFQDRLHFGIHSELLDLMKLPSLNGVRARALFDSGFETVTSIASADANIIENILHKAVPFQSEKEREGDDSADVKKRNKIRSIWITGSCGKTPKEAAENLITEARRYLETEIGVTGIKWSSADSNSDNNNKNVSQNICDTERDTVNDAITHKDTETKTQASKTRQSIDILEVSSEDVYINARSSEVNDKQTHTVNTQIINDINIGSANKSPVNEEILSKSNKISTPVTNMSPDIILHSPIGATLLWESLNFDEIELKQLKNAANTNFSPNISFGETEKVNISINKKDACQLAKSNSTESTSTKDVSIFSSDGDTSLFEESLPLDQIPSKLLDNQASMKETTKDFVNINTNSIINVFESLLTDDEDEIKLVFEEESDKEETVNNENEVGCSQKNITKVTNFMTPTKRRLNKSSDKTHEAKRKRIDVVNLPKLLITISDFNKLNLILLKSDNVSELNNLLKDKAAIYFVYGEKQLNKDVIGNHVTSDQSRFRENYGIKGLAMYLSGALCVYVDITSLDDIKRNELKTYFEKDRLILKVLSLKSNYIYLKNYLGVCSFRSYVDISTVEWLIHGNETIDALELWTENYFKIKLMNKYVRVDDKKLLYTNLDAHIQACIKAWCIWHIAEEQNKLLSNQHDVRSVTQRENHISVILAESERLGIRVDRSEASAMLVRIQKALSTLQSRVDRLAGTKVNINSSKRVAKLVGIHTNRRVSTKKSVLSNHESPLANTVIYWRKLNFILTKILYPITQRAVIYSQGDRIRPSYSTHTCTGRMSMHEPNLQSVPRTFTIPAGYLQDTQTEFNCRHIFKASEGYVMLSADYCQLEMRILTHFSEDEVLISIMRRNEDVFKSIAASWCNVPESEVDGDLRQKAKQLCYGIIYGMGNHTLAQELDVSDLDAASFMDTFFKTFPKIKPYTERVLQKCRDNGYVETLMKRRRYFPDIKSQILLARSAAERKAVNTTIQGSAADIAKAAMCEIDSQTNRMTNRPRLLLQMHDELIYEVKETDKSYFIDIMKRCMEQTIKLKVPLPVKVKCGYSWGQLNEI